MRVGERYRKDHRVDLVEDDVVDDCLNVCPVRHLADRSDNLKDESRSNDWNDQASHCIDSNGQVNGGIDPTGQMSRCADSNGLVNGGTDSNGQASGSVDSN